MQNTKKDGAKELFTEGYTKILLGLLHRHAIINDKKERYDVAAIKKLEGVFEYVQENYTREISLEEISSTMGMNREYFCRLFKKEKGITPLHYRKRWESGKETKKPQEGENENV